MRRQDGDTVHCLPFLATMFHAAGLNVMNPSERKREVLEISTMAVSDMIVVGEACEVGAHTDILS